MPAIMRLRLTAALRRLPLILLAAPAVLASPIALDSPTTLWTVVALSGVNQFDYLVDQQTGSAESDIVGNGSHPAFFYSFDNGGTPDNHIDGTLSFRVRLGREKNPPGFESAFLVGIEANGDNRVDLFVGVDNRGGTNQLRIWSPGSGLNTGPSTTSVTVPSSPISYSETATTYHWGPVNATSDPNATSYDLYGDGTDYFLSLAFPFADIVSEMSRLSQLSITDVSLLRFIIATSNQDNALNQDLGGINGGVNSTQTWGDLGGFTSAGTLTPQQAEDVVVPEVSTYLLTISGLGALLTVMAPRKRH